MNPINSINPINPINSINSINPINSKLGLIIGYGLLPEIFVKEVKGVEFYVIGFKKYFSKKVLKCATEYRILNSLDLEQTINFFKKYNVDKVLFLGYVPHTLLVNNKIFFDKKISSLLQKLKKNSAMELFNKLLSEFENVGIKVEPINKYLPDNFATKGNINSLELNEEELENVNFGYEMAKKIAELDIGLTVVVKNKVIVAVEALEGTDKCILRAKNIAGSGCYVIKVARPNQDMRFDLPVIGPKTVKVLKSAKAKVLAVESGKTLILNKQEVIEKLRKYNIKFYGI